MDQEQNLINPAMVTLPSHSGKSAGFYKTIVLDALSILAAFALGYSYREYLVAGASLLVVIGVFLVFGVFSALQALLCKEAGRRAFIVLCEVVALGSFFYAIDVHFLIAAAASAFILFFWGYLGSRSEIDYGMEIRPFKVTRSVIGKVMTGTIIFMIVIYIPLWNQNSVFIPEKSFDAFFNWGASVIETFNPKISLSGSVGDLVDSIARTQLESAPSFKSLSPQNQNALIAQGANGIIDNISKNIGINIQSSDTINAAVYQFVTNTFTGWENRFQGAFFVGWGVVLFFVARSIGIIFVWIDQLLFVFVYEVLRAFRFMRIIEESRMKEIVKY
jgi:hypothetical protein